MVSISEIENALLEGVQDANRKYERWSRGWWLTDSGVESHMASTIAGKLHWVAGEMESVAMEMHFGDIKDWSNAKPDPPRLTEKAGYRADIVMLARNWRPVCVIEVKRTWKKTTCFEDLERIRDLILECGREEGGSLSRGYLAFMLAEWGDDKAGKGKAEAEEKLAAQLRKIKDEVDQEFDREGLKLKFTLSPEREYPKRYRELHYRTEESWVHAGVCIGLRIPNRRANT